MSPLLIEEHLRSKCFSSNRIPPFRGSNFLNHIIKRCYGLLSSKEIMRLCFVFFLIRVNADDTAPAVDSKFKMVRTLWLIPRFFFFSLWLMSKDFSHPLLTARWADSFERSHNERCWWFFFFFILMIWTWALRAGLFSFNMLERRQDENGDRRRGLYFKT